MSKKKTTLIIVASVLGGWLGLSLLGFWFLGKELEEFDKSLGMAFENDDEYYG